ncbi:hypothetical protein WR25_07608 [Diploscapter pachys]|uniref:RanBD1 domain-containing protein n=1 Tax=Diploscapter pachys TaxID=2018661 RepID=A0A2A2KQX8_9BILA|nr:hypothetical protein WR25_07608 [Diploscapter pachys]
MTAPPPTKKMFFKPSALSAKADQLWSESKSEFVASNTNPQIHLEKKKLDDVLIKIASVNKEENNKDKISSFIFGSNISERVTKENIEGNSGIEKTDDGQLKKTAEELFKCAGESSQAAVTHDFRAEAEAAAMEEKKETEKQLATTSVIQNVTTGEENDHSIYQMACKIHAFDNERKIWVEKGLSNLKINRRTENGITHHRIDMFLEKIDKKRIKLSAFGPDSTAVQIFLITIGFSKADTRATSEGFYNKLSEILQIAKGESSRKRKIMDEPDVDADKVDLKDGEEAESEETEGSREGCGMKLEEEEDKEKADEVDRDETKEESTSGTEEVAAAADEKPDENSEDDFVLVEKPNE